jgi:DHA1 family multidrug resistance protein-like MFS transporter
MINIPPLYTPFIILAVIMFISQLGVGLVVPVLPQYIETFGASGAQLGYLVAAMGSTLFLFSPAAGSLSDQYGRKKLIVGGIGLFGVSQFIFGFTNDMWMLYLSRLVGGIGIACMSPAITAYITDITSLEQRGRMHGWIGAAMSLGFVSGPVIGGFLANYGLRLPFYLAAAMALLAMAACQITLPETQGQAAQLAARRAQQKQSNVFAQLASSINAPYLLLLVFIFVMAFGLASIEAVFGLYVDEKYGFTPQDIAILITAGALMGVLAQSLLIEKLLRRFREIQVINASLFLSAICLLLMLLSGNFTYLLIVSMVYFAALSTLRPTINTLLSRIAGQDQGFVAGLNNAYTSLGIIFGPITGGFLFDLDMDLPFLASAIIILLSLLIPLFWSKKQAQPL